MRFPSVPIFKSSLQVISFFLDASHSHIFLFVCFTWKSTFPFPSQVYHFPLLLLNASYSNGMFSEFPPVTGLAASRLCIITSAENTRVQNPRSDPGTWDSFSDLEQTLMGALSPFLCAHENGSWLKRSLEVLKCKSVRRWSFSGAIPIRAVRAFCWPNSECFQPQATPGLEGTGGSFKPQPGMLHHSKCMT